MNTNVRSSNGYYRRVLARGLVAVAGCMRLAGSAGCGPGLGSVLYIWGLVPEQKVKAEFKIPPGPVLILVDDDLDLVEPPVAREELVAKLTAQLREHKAVEQVTTNEEIGLIRRSVPDFDRLSIREVGRKAKADTVMWMSVDDFYVDDDPEMLVNPARFAVRLKVFNVNEEDKRKLRLWPPEREGRPVSLTVRPTELRECKSRADVHQLLAKEMADKVAKLFYDYTIERK
jgi:hypothetical protein